MQWSYLLLNNTIVSLSQCEDFLTPRGSRCTLPSLLTPSEAVGGGVRGRSLTMDSWGTRALRRDRRGGGKAASEESGRWESCRFFVRLPSTSWPCPCTLEVFAVSTVEFVARDPPTICGRTRAAECLGSVGVLALAGVTKDGERLSWEDTRDKTCRRCRRREGNKRKI